MLTGNVEKRRTVFTLHAGFPAAGSLPLALPLVTPAAAALPPPWPGVFHSPVGVVVSSSPETGQPMSTNPGWNLFSFFSLSLTHSFETPPSLVFSIFPSSPLSLDGSFCFTSFFFAQRRPNFSTSRPWRGVSVVGRACCYLLSLVTEVNVSRRFMACEKLSSTSGQVYRPKNKIK